MRPVPRETSHAYSNDPQRLQIDAGTCRWTPQSAHLWIRSSRAAHPSQKVSVTDSEAGGARFWFTLPVASDAAEADCPGPDDPDAERW